VPRADLVMPNGTTVSIEGTPDEVAALVDRLTAAPASPPERTVAAQKRGRTGQRPDKPAARSTVGPRELIRELRDSDFFRTMRGLGDVQKALEEAAHIYPITTLSPVLFRMVRSKELRRLKENGTWKYVNP
jgi:hypothetical protein